MDRLRQHPALAAELTELFDILDDQADHIPEPLDDHDAMGASHPARCALEGVARRDPGRVRSDDV